MGENKADQVIWWLMITFASVLIFGGGAWAHNINSKVEKIAGMELSINYIRNDINDIKELLKTYMKKGQ